VIQPVEAAKFLERVTNGPNGGLRMRSVAGESEGAFPKFALGGSNAGWFPAYQGDAGSGRDKGAGGGEAKAGSAADDDERFFGERQEGRGCGIQYSVSSVLYPVFCSAESRAALFFFLLLEEVQAFLNVAGGISVEIFAHELAALHQVSDHFFALNEGGLEQFLQSEA